ncbi:ATP-binding cassette, subfamily B, MsbA [Paenibacillus sp. UNCCL117]|uniref:ABC transporter ATP-binding protein n=1 Tax=unclassified Paenibacillus TaxID=185978 RepID=UPI0008856169|nr:MULTISPECIES: ABC transporter ATP-binding protein [unclassified Paenibacillus]SDE61555.1 ATP-binding cassette, subfamily B, MsbA [Paenibacillus sp. cl123]SFW69775.1 ATP-binding cassette, subfamily B, MsbA [Paenibacillus sp. UNCCL117]
MKETQLRIRLNAIQDLKLYILKRRMSMIGVATVQTMLLSLGLLTPFLYKLFIDNVLILQQIELLKWLIAGYIAIYACETLLQFLSVRLNAQVTYKFSNDLRMRMWRRFHFSPDFFYNPLPVGEMRSRLDKDIQTIEPFLSKHIISYILNGVFIIVYGVILFNVNYKLFLFGMLMVPLSFWMTSWLGNGVKKTSEEYRVRWSSYENWLQRSLESWKAIKILGSSRSETRVFTRHWQGLSRSFFIKQLYWCGNKSFISFKDFFVTRMNLYFLGGLLIYNQELTIGGLLVFMSFYELFFSKIGLINQLDLQISDDYPALKRLTSLVGESTNSENPGGWARINQIRVIDASFTDGEHEVLSNLSFTIDKGERIAIVGKSGAGKSSLVKLLSGIIVPTSGEVLFDQTPVRDIMSTGECKEIGVVLQDSFLFNLSILDNLKLVSPNAAFEEIENACKKAAIHEFISSLPNGYETLVGERGVKLSGGQKQRLLIARLFVQNPSLVIFDEATSQLDFESEERLLCSIGELSVETTTIIIAHRLSTIKNADRIIVMDNGTIVGDGSHVELLRDHAVYRGLFHKSIQDVS